MQIFQEVFRGGSLTICSFHILVVSLLSQNATTFKPYPSFRTMKFRTILCCVTVAATLISCGGSSEKKPTNVTDDAIASAEQKHPSKESALLGYLPSYQIQSANARYYVDSVYRAKINKIDEDIESQQMTESNLKKYGEEYEKIASDKKETLAEVDAKYKSKIEEEIKRVFGDNNRIDIPVDKSSLNDEWFKDVTCYLTPVDNGFKLIFDIYATPEGCKEGFDIAGPINVLKCDYLRLKAFDSDGNELFFHHFLDLRGSKTDYFTGYNTLDYSDLSPLANLAYIKIEPA